MNLDEPTAALGGEETQLLFRQIERLKAEGVCIIYTSHRLEEIRQIADRIVVMRDGIKVKELETADVSVRTIVEAMVGWSIEQMFPVLAQGCDQKGYLTGGGGSQIARPRPRSRDSG